MDSFFEAEVELERKICRDVVCVSRKDEEGTHTALHTSVSTVLPSDGKTVSGVCVRLSP